MPSNNRHVQNGFMQAARVWGEFIRSGSTNLPVMSAGAPSLADSFAMPERMPAERAFFSGLAMTGHGSKIDAWSLSQAAKGAEFKLIRNGYVRRSA